MSWETYERLYPKPLTPAQQACWDTGHNAIVCISATCDIPLLTERETFRYCCEYTFDRADDFPTNPFTRAYVRKALDELVKHGFLVKRTTRYKT